jgi:hypothetical protein
VLGVWRSCLEQWQPAARAPVVGIELADLGRGEHEPVILPRTQHDAAGIRDPQLPLGERSVNPVI